MTAVTDNFDSPLIPLPVIGNVAIGGDIQARMDIGDHTDTSLAVLFLLAEDENADVRFALAENHNIHEGVLNLLAEDPNPYVACRAQKTLARLKRNAVNVVHLVSEVGTVEGCSFSNPREKRTSHR